MSIFSNLAQKFKSGATLGKSVAESTSKVTTQIFAHRGSRCNRPENTLASFREAMALNVDGIELDVHLSVDHSLVVIHDETIDRTTNGRGFVRYYTTEELKTFDAGSWFSSDFLGERIPLLTDVLLELTESNFTGILNIEIKTNNYQYPNIEKILSDLMTSQNYPFSYLYSSFNLESLKIIRAFEPNTELALLTHNKSKEIMMGEEASFVNCLHPKKTFLFNHLAHTSTKTSKPLRIWTINKDSDIRAAFRSNIKGIITDYPERALQLRNTIKRPSL